ncbi:MAG TPA: rRNA maturation RNase YbeY [Solirubrobacteraceae bacterium]
MSAALLDVEVIGADGLDGVPGEAEIRSLCDAAADAAGLTEGHLAIAFVDPGRIAELNERHRSIAKPTDVLSFPIDEFEELSGVERELGDVVICPEHTEDLREAIVHGVLHLLGMDHETDDGEMLALQAKILAGVRGARGVR